VTDSQTFQTLQTAIRHGGGFMAKLAEAGLVADPDNRRKLLEAFPQLEQCFGPQTTLHHR
jgi:hypothetical protein